ncbi:hypothetical protein [Flavobacterium sp. 120]|uniref:hypothetical protein n=1 Tax=Flavobacterium sp. 120 TaxID=2135626 RepID=UPI0011C38202|nr:hypothetical protein [Flavobacterium sp. 120]
MENENHFYKHKMDNAQSLLLGIMKLMDDYQNILSDFHESEKLNKLDSIKEKEIDIQIDQVTEVFRKTIIQHSLFLPQNILDLIEKFYDGLFDEENKAKDNSDVDKYIDTKLEEIENLAYKIREDLGIEKLNIGLKKRIRSNIKKS